MTDYSELKAEIDNDPAGLGYAGKTRAERLDLLNARVGTPTIPLASIPRDPFMTSLVPAYLALAAKSADIQAKWDRIIRVLNGSTLIVPIPGLFGLAVLDGILTQAQADAAWHRAASRADALFGVDTIITDDDMARAGH